MTFIEDPKNGRRVADSESGHALTQIYRDVPIDEQWFDFVFESTKFLVKAKFSWSDNGSRCTYTLQAKQLEDSFQQSAQRHEQPYKPNPEEFRVAVLPALRDAIVARLALSLPAHTRKNLKVDVNFAEPNM
jgi:hypothetical protein